MLAPPISKTLARAAITDRIQNAFWTYFGISNILTEAALILLPLFIILKLQMEGKRKFSILCCFGARVL